MDEIQTAIEACGVAPIEALAARDEKNGNQCAHIAAQNGHRNLIKYLVEQKVSPNGQNNKGQTPLHMSISYDFYFLSKYLIDHGADLKKKNVEGHEAMKGIDGDKVGNDAYDAPLNILKDATDDAEELKLAFEGLEGVDPSTLDKAGVVQAGMKKKKACPTHWDAERFTAIMKKI